MKKRFALLFLLPALALGMPEDCEKKIRLVVNNSARFAEPKITRLFSIQVTQRFFESLKARECALMPLVMTRIMGVPEWLAAHTDLDSVSVQVLIENLTMERPTRVVTFTEGTLPEDSQSRLVLHIPRVWGDRFFVENLIPRTAIYRLLREAAAEFSHSRLLKGTRISKWEMSDVDAPSFSSAQLEIDLTGLSHAEFATLLNKIAWYFDSRGQASTIR